MRRVALVVCRGSGPPHDVVARAVRRAGLEPVRVRTTARARRILDDGGVARGEIRALVADADVRVRGDGLDLVVSAAFEHPRLHVVLLHARAASDDAPDPVLGIALSDVRCPVLRRPVQEAVLARALVRACPGAHSSPTPLQSSDI